MLLTGAALSNAIAIQGRITIENSGGMRATLIDALSSRPANLSVDQSGMPYIDTSGLATLVEAVGTAHRQGTCGHAV